MSHGALTRLQNPLLWCYSWGTCKPVHFAEPFGPWWPVPHSSGFLNRPPRWGQSEVSAPAWLMDWSSEFVPALPSAPSQLWLENLVLIFPRMEAHSQTPASPVTALTAVTLRPTFLGLLTYPCFRPDNSGMLFSNPCLQEGIGDEGARRAP